MTAVIPALSLALLSLALVCHYLQTGQRFWVLGGGGKLGAYPFYFQGGLESGPGLPTLHSAGAGSYLSKG